MSDRSVPALVIRIDPAYLSSGVTPKTSFSLATTSPARPGTTPGSGVDSATYLLEKSSMVSVVLSSLRNALLETINSDSPGCPWATTFLIGTSHEDMRQSALDTGG